LLNNFNAVTAMLAGLTSSPVFRLKYTWNELAPKVRKIQETVENEMSSANSFKIYRELLKTRHPPLIPFLGIILSDLTFTEEGNLNNTPDGLVNWGKRALLAGVLTRFKAQQLKANYDIEESQMKDCILQEIEKKMVPPGDLYDLSLKIEPRDGPGKKKSTLRRRRDTIF